MVWESLILLFFACLFGCKSAVFLLIFLGLLLLLADTRLYDENMQRIQRRGKEPFGNTVCIYFFDVVASIFLGARIGVSNRQQGMALYSLGQAAIMRAEAWRSSNLSREEHR